MAANPLLADPGRAFDLLKPVDESKRGFPPDPEVSADDRERTGLKAYPTETHRANLRASD